MKLAQRILYFLMIMSFVTTVIFIYFLPKDVPIHFDLAGSPDHFASRNKNLLWPFSSLVIGIFILLIADKYKRSIHDRLIFFIIGDLLLSVLYSESLLFMIFQLCYNPNNPKVFTYDLLKSFCVLIGALVLIFGILMPRLPYASVFGLRTRWSMSGDEIWKKCQRIGGLFGVPTGAAIIVISILINSELALIFTVFLIMIWALVCTTVTMVIGKKKSE